MSEATVVLSEILPKKSEKAPNAAKDGNGEVWKSWDVKFDEAIGRRVKLTYEPKSREYQGRTFTDNIVSALEEVASETNGDTPALGTGEYVTGQKPTIEVRRIAAAIAWKAAAHLTDTTMRHTVGREITPGFVIEVAQKHANEVFVDLLRKGQALTDEDIPF